MADEPRHISDEDAQAIADAITGRSREGRLEAGRNEVNQIIGGQLAQRRQQQKAHLSRTFGWSEDKES